MRVDLLDPSAYTPPYDRALAGALVAAPDAPARVRLLTSPFAYGEVPPVDPRVDVEERFYTRAAGREGSLLRRASKLVTHVPDMLAYRREVDAGRPSATDISHFQWLPVQQIDERLLPRRVPIVLTAHDVLPREPRPGQRRAQRRLYERVDHVVVHSEHGRGRLLEELGIDAAKVSVIAHGAFTGLRDVEPVLPPELRHERSRPVALLAGLLREYKGIDVLLDAWRSFGDDLPGELWIAGLPRVELPPLPPGVRLVPRFLSDAELAGVLTVAGLVVLPYREIDQSGVLYAALGLGRPLLLSDVGGFPEIAAAGAAELVPSGDAEALAAALRWLLEDGDRRTVLAEKARVAAETTYSWESAADAHLRLYRSMIAS